MENKFGINKGMGIGGWLTNYKRFNVLPKEWRLPITVGDMEHFMTYITEWDIENIKNMGLDHVRLGFDQIVLEEKPYVYRENIMQKLDEFIEWCEKRNLAVIFNLHKAVGNYCDIDEDVKLLESDELQNRFIALWVFLEKRFSKNKRVMFELLNEVRNVEPMLWNNLAEKTINEIRKINKNRVIIVGSTCWNSAATLKNLKIFDDENVIYTFHTYAPFEFTHQQGVLQAAPMYYNRKMPYPADIEIYKDFAKTVSGNNDAYKEFTKMDIDFIRYSLKPAADFVKAHPDKTLWCGEFGTIRHCNIKYRENWMRDVITVLKEIGIPYCVWNYLSTPNDGNRFSLVDDDKREILSEEMLKVINGDF